jgi:hypothetical protein
MVAGSQLDADQESRRVRFNERHIGVHFSNPVQNRDGMWGGCWVDADGKHEVRKATLKELLDELEQMFGLRDSPRAGVSLSGTYAYPREGPGPPPGPRAR